MAPMKSKDSTVDYPFNIIGRFIPEIGPNRSIICLFPCSGLNGEGWFDPHSLLAALKQRNIGLGVRYIDAEVIGFTKKLSAPGTIGNQYVLASVIVSMCLSLS